MATRKHEVPTVGVVVITHGQAGPDMVVAAQAIVGAIPGITAVAIEGDDNANDVVGRIARACEQVDNGAGVLIMLDVHGSSPFHAAMTMMDGTRQAEVLCGVNLPMLIKLATVDRRTRLPAELAEELRESGRRSIRLGSELTGRVSVGRPR